MGGLAGYERRALLWRAWVVKNKAAVGPRGTRATSRVKRAVRSTSEVQCGRLVWLAVETWEGVATRIAHAVRRASDVV